MNKRAMQIVPTLLAASVLLALAGTAAAQSAQAASDTNPQPPTTSSDQAKQPATLSTVVVTGTRVLGRTLKDSLQPVDVVSGETLRQTGAFDFGTALSRAIPSLNFPMVAVAAIFQKDPSVLIAHPGQRGEVDPGRQAGGGQPDGVGDEAGNVLHGRDPVRPLGDRPSDGRLVDAGLQRVGLRVPGGG